MGRWCDGRCLSTWIAPVQLRLQLRSKVLRTFGKPFFDSIGEGCKNTVKIIGDDSTAMRVGSTIPERGIVFEEA
jgi:hypothetical protein